MTEPTSTPTEPPPRRRARRWLLAVIALVVLGFVAWHYLVELPAEQRATAEFKRQQAEHARSIPDLNVDLVWIPTGTFLMGRNPEGRWFYEVRDKLTKQESAVLDSGINEWTMTQVTLTRPFWLGRTEVTQAQWMAVMGTTPSHFKGENLPVESVTWEAAIEFCRKLTERERVAGRLPAGYAYTLPTEAQWEYACRAGTTGEYAGDLDKMAWYSPNSGGTTHPVGTKQVNAWGLADMEGNVSEWCADLLGNYPGGQVTNPKGPTPGSGTTNRNRVYRGGSWSDDAGNCRSAWRFGLDGHADTSPYLSLRLALIFSP